VADQRFYHSMLGRSTAISGTAPTRWLRKYWGVADIHTRQKWNIAWPHLSKLPQEGVNLLDAGCGAGQWSLEIAARRPHWNVVGLDKDRQGIELAEQARVQLQLTNVSFKEVNLLDVDSQSEYDVILSIESSHYLAEAGRGRELFEKYAGLLRHGGEAIVVASRARKMVPVWSALPKPPLHSVFSEASLTAYCGAAGLTVEQLEPRLGALAMAAKQVSLAASASIVTRVVAYPLQLLLGLADDLPFVDKRSSSCSWFLSARKRLVLSDAPGQSKEDHFDVSIQP
jgi:2-polyprenyl-3-methyl-5-hydroxy-6-metoxy-1,4-benzoquinol methylase